MINSTDTICALSTATGGALGIIRISGPDTFTIVSALCSVPCKTVAANTIHYTHIVEPVAEHQQQVPTVIDEAMVAVFKSPHSYTGEDCVEISCHGSRYILNKVLELLVRQGCRMAEPGEFTKRAYLNGKMDLSQAEAVADLIASSNRATHHMAMSQLRGHFSSQLTKLRDQLLQLTSLLELELDFSDHEDLEFADRTELLRLAVTIDECISTLAHSFQTGQALKKGIPVAIIGKTNVGKSTLLNKLLRDERAIVSDIHGTTRDTIEDTIDLHGASFRFIDTAGIRQTDDAIEQIGIDRTFQAIDRAQIVLWLIDTVPSDDEQKAIAARCKGKNLIIIANKSDKGNPIDEQAVTIPHTSFISMSAKFGTNLNLLEKTIYEAADLPEISENDIIVTNARHYQALLRAHEDLSQVITGLQDQLPGDLLAEDLRMVLSTLADITGGQITPQETLNTIFSHFCIGK